MFRPFTAIIVSFCFGNFSNGQDIGITRHDAGITRADRTDIRIPVNQPEPGMRPWPPTAIEERVAALGGALPPAPPKEPAQKGVVSVQQVQNPITPKKAEALEEANREVQSGNFDAGMARLREALADPALAGYAHGMLGTAYLKRGEIAPAIEHLTEAVRLIPGEAAGHSNLGYALAASGQWKRAEKELRKAIALRSTDPYPNFILGVLLLGQKGSEPEAELRLLAAQHHIPRASLALAILFEKQQDSAAVEKEILRIATQPYERETLRSWVQATAALQNPAAAFGLFPAKVEEE